MKDIQHSKQERYKRKILPVIYMVLVITVMVFAAEISGEKEIIFPEVAAIACGAFIAPKMPWVTNYIRMFICIAICAVLGVLIVMFLPVPLWAQLIVAYAVSQIIFLASGTGFAPMISAIVLPVILQSKGSVYPIAAVCLTAIVILLCISLHKLGVKKYVYFKPLTKPGNIDIIITIIRIGVTAVCILAALKIDMRFCIAPPLLVAFTELCNPKSKQGERPVSVVIVVSLCALVGATARLFFTVSLVLPLTLSALITAVVMIFIITAFKLFFPPACAMGILAMLIPDAALKLYPLQVLIGITALVICGKLIAVLSVKLKTMEKANNIWSDLEGE